MPTGNNESSAHTAFIQRKAYRDWAYPPPSWIPTPINLWEDKFFFGRLDYNGNSIIVNQQFLTKLVSTRGTHFALNFVCDAFKDLQTYYTVAASTGRITTENTNLKVLEGQGGWKDVNDEYLEYLKGLYKVFASGFMQAENRDKKLLSYKDFLSLFELFIDYALPNFPLSKSAFIASKFSDPASSGLMIKILFLLVMIR